MQDKAASAANEGAYLLYVTEICKRSQRRKQNCVATLRLRDFVVGLGDAKRLCTSIQKTPPRRLAGLGERDGKTRSVTGRKAPGRKSRAAAERPPPRGDGRTRRKESVCARGWDRARRLRAGKRRHWAGWLCPAFTAGHKKSVAHGFFQSIHERRNASREKSPAFPLYKKLQRKYNDSCKVRFQPLRMEACSPYAGGGVLEHSVPALHFFVP